MGDLLRALRVPPSRTVTHRHHRRAMLTVFILLTGEWIDAMEPAAAIIGAGCAAFFIFVVVLGKYLLMNVLVAVILKEFAEEDTGPATSRSDNAVRSSTPALQMAHSVRSSVGAHQSSAADKEAGGVPDQNEKKEDAGAWPVDHSLYIFSPSNPIRQVCRWLIKQPQFDQVSICVMRSCIHRQSTASILQPPASHSPFPSPCPSHHAPHHAPHMAGDHRCHHRLVGLPRARLAPPRTRLWLGACPQGLRSLLHRCVT